MKENSVLKSFRLWSTALPPEQGQSRLLPRNKLDVASIFLVRYLTDNLWAKQKHSLSSRL